MENRDRSALLVHFHRYHKKFIKPTTKLHNCFEVIFLQQPPVEKLDFFESQWVSNLGAKINIAKTALPEVK